MKFHPSDQVYYISTDSQERVYRVVDYMDDELRRVWFTNGHWMQPNRCFPVSRKKKGFAQWASAML